jgi:hypothetical protein
MSIAQQTITIAGSTLYTSTGGSAITAMFFMNNHSSTVVIQLHVVKNGDGISATNKIIKDLSIAAGDTYIIDTEKLLLDNGDSIRATADVDSVVNVTTSYIGV